LRQTSATFLSTNIKKMDDKIIANTCLIHNSNDVSCDNHSVDLLTQQLTKKTPKTFVCEKCNYICKKASDWERHISTKKHTNEGKEKQYICGDCGKTYKIRQSLHVHKNKCQMKHKINHNKKYQNTEEEKMSDENMQIAPELMMLLVQQNKEMYEMMKHFNQVLKQPQI